MFRTRLPLVCILALTLTTLACILPIGSANRTPTVPVIEVTATPLIPPTAAAASPSEAVPSTQAPSSSGATPSTPATLPPDCTLDSDFVSDVNIPDRSPIKANSVFVKTWRLRNSSTCPWNSAFKFVQISGGMLTATPNMVPLPDVPMGGEVEISMTLTLSSAAPVGSEQTARFQIQAPDGRLFGTKPFVKILVASSTGSITGLAGLVWEDVCRVASGTPSAGCIPSVGGGYRGNGIMDEAPIIAGVRIDLRSGSCSGSIVATFVTTATIPGDGEYWFNNLAPGTYCVSIDALDAANSKILIPGNWTYPPGMFDSAVATAIVTLSAGEYAGEVSFAWDYQLD